MEDNNFNIVIVDDTMGEEDPLVVELKLDFPEAIVTYFNGVKNAMSFVEKHMSERIIIFMDCRFGSVWQGVDAILELREKTSLIYVVMMSANNLSQLGGDYIAALINADNIFFIRNTDVDGAKEKVRQIQNLWKSQFDCILERWLLKHPENSNKEAFRESDDKKYTWADILRELRLRTAIGRSFEQVLNEYYIDQLKQLEE